MSAKNKQLVSRQRVYDHGEVYTADAEVQAMLNLVNVETERIDSIFLEPACGTGNFLVEIAIRKLNTASANYLSDQVKYELSSIKIATSLYGIDLLEDNIITTRSRLFQIFQQQYQTLFLDACKEEYLNVIQFILDKNIITGNALTFNQSTNNSLPILVSSWKFDDYNIVRTEYPFAALFNNVTSKNETVNLKSGTHPIAVNGTKTYGSTHFLNIHKQTKAVVENANHHMLLFDVIVGNPPYQMSDGGTKTGAVPLYHLFVLNALKLLPRYLTMIIPSRWFAGGRGLDTFRASMLNDKRIRVLHDFPDASVCFPGVEIKGGVCYFLWDRDNPGLCEVTTHQPPQKPSLLIRPLLEQGRDTFIRYNDAITILHKVSGFNEPSFKELLSSMKPFGFRTYFQGEPMPFEGAVKIYANKNVGYVNRHDVKQNVNWINEHKVIITRAFGTGNSKTDQLKPIYAAPGSCCTETYIVVGPFASKQICDNVISYIKTQFFHFMLTLRKNTQDAPRRMYSFIPKQEFSQPWDDDKLFEKYKLNATEIFFIKNTVRNFNT